MRRRRRREGKESDGRFLGIATTTTTTTTTTDRSRTARSRLPTVTGRDGEWTIVRTIVRAGRKNETSAILATGGRIARDARRFAARARTRDPARHPGDVPTADAARGVSPSCLRVSRAVPHCEPTASPPDLGVDEPSRRRPRPSAPTRRACEFSPPPPRRLVRAPRVARAATSSRTAIPRASHRRVILAPAARRSSSSRPRRRAARALARRRRARCVFEKLFKFVGKNLKNIVDRADQPHCFRLHKKVRAGSSTRRRGATRDALVLPNSSRGNDERNPVVVILRALDDRSRSLPRSNAPPRATRRRRTRGDEEEISALLNASALKHKTISWLNFFN
eukprot:29123-Pelagococcus_subviridis.AAC.4